MSAKYQAVVRLVAVASHEIKENVLPARRLRVSIAEELWVQVFSVDRNYSLMLLEAPLGNIGLGKHLRYRRRPRLKLLAHELDEQVLYIFLDLVVLLGQAELLQDQF